MHKRMLQRYLIMGWGPALCCCELWSEMSDNAWTVKTDHVHRHPTFKGCDFFFFFLVSFMMSGCLANNFLEHGRPQQCGSNANLG